MADKIYGNRTTKVAHRRGKRGDPCFERALALGNSEHFPEFADAKADGYRACKRCRPDKA